MDDGTLHCVAALPGGTHSRFSQTKLHATVTIFIIMIFFHCNLQRFAKQRAKTGETWAIFKQTLETTECLKLHCQMQPQTLLKPIRAVRRGFEAAA